MAEDQRAPAGKSELVGMAQSQLRIELDAVGERAVRRGNSPGPLVTGGEPKHQFAVPMPKEDADRNQSDWDEAKREVDTFNYVPRTALIAAAVLIATIVMFVIGFSNEG
jgi:hypothetical protein